MMRALADLAQVVRHAAVGLRFHDSNKEAESLEAAFLHVMDRAEAVLAATRTASEQVVEQAAFLAEEARTDERARCADLARGWTMRKGTMQELADLIERKQ